MSKTYNQLSDYINWAMGLSFTVAAFLLSKDTLIEVIQNDIFRGVLTILLLAITLAVYFLYARAVQTELDLVDAVFATENVEPGELSGNYFLAIIAISVFFGAVIGNITNILFYSGAMVLYSMFDLFGVSIVIRNFTIYFGRKEFRDKPLIEKEADVLFDYYVGRPILTRIATILIFNCIAFSFSVHSYITGDELGATIAYFVMIINIVISEIAIFSWRKARNNSLQEIRDERKRYLLSERGMTSQTKETPLETEE